MCKSHGIPQSSELSCEFYFELRPSWGVKTMLRPNQDHYSENIHDWQRSTMYVSSSSGLLNIGLTAIVYIFFEEKSESLKKDWRLKSLPIYPQFIKENVSCSSISRNWLLLELIGPLRIKIDGLFAR